MNKIVDYFTDGLTVTGNDGVAGLAQFVDFDPCADCSSIHACAFHALIEEYGISELTYASIDHYTGFTVVFNDGSKIEYHVER